MTHRAIHAGLHSADPAVLVVDVGGSHVKVLATGEAEPRRFESGPTLTAKQMVERVREVASGWRWQRVTVGIPTPVRGGHVIAEPVNLGEGWVGFDYERAFGAPTKVVNDAVMQAVGSYEGGRMLFLGLGTGLGSALIVDGIIEPLELGHLLFREKTFEDYVNARALAEGGKEKWQESVFEIVDRLRTAMAPDYVVIGGGVAAELDVLPPGTRRGDNGRAFVGGARVWDDEWLPRAAIGERLAVNKRPR